MGTHPIFESDFDCLTDIESFRKNYQKVKKVLAMNEMEMAAHYHRQADIFNQRRRTKRTGISEKKSTGKRANQRSESSTSGFKVPKEPSGRKRTSRKVPEEIPITSGMDDGFILPTQECVYNPDLGIFEEIRGSENGGNEEPEASGENGAESEGTEMKAIPAGDVFDPEDRFWAPPADKFMTNNELEEIGSFVNDIQPGRAPPFAEDQWRTDMICEEVWRQVQNATR